MTRTMATGMLLLLTIACQGEEQSNMRQAPPAGGLAGKHFSDDQFLCTLPPKPRGAALHGAELLDGEVEVTYEGQIKGLLKKACVTCHNPTVGQAPDLSTAEAAQAEAEASLASMLDGSMPPGGSMSDGDIELFEAWIEAGMPLAASGGTPNSGANTGNASGGDLSEFCAPLPERPAPQTPTPPAPQNPPAGDAPTYRTAIQALLKDQCVTCHQGGIAPPDLDTYAKAKAGGPRSLIRIQDGTMPPNKPLSPADMEMFKAWVDAGYPEDAP